MLIIKKVGYVVDCNSKMIADSILDYFENDREEHFSSNLKAN